MKTARILISGSVLALVVFSFFSFSPFMIVSSSLFSRIQFFPSLLRFFFHAGGMAASGFIAILIVTLLFGRLYCSSLCPLGTIQDGAVFLAVRIRKKHFRYRKSLFPLGLLVACAIIITLVAGTPLLANLLEPYSFAGRIINTVFKPLALLLNNQVAKLAELADIYLIKSKFVYFSLPSFVITISAFLALVAAASVRGRIFCNSLCPVGALLALPASVSLFKIRIHTSTCTSCGLCEAACKASCKDSKNKHVDAGRCILCFSCLSVCKRTAIRYVVMPFPEKKPSETVTGFTSERRHFLAGTLRLGMFLLILSLQKAFPQEPPPGVHLPVVRKKTLPVFPPGGGTVKSFILTCTACQACIAVCPNGILKGAFLQFGISGIMQPYLDFSQGFCEYECKRCSEVCPTGALKQMAIGEKKLTKLGEVNFIKDECIVYKQGTACGACAEHCPTHAVQMYPYENSLFVPEFVQEACIGCGACEFVCPAKPKAVYVNGLSEHRRIEKALPPPAPPQYSPPESEEEDFPF